MITIVGARGIRMVAIGTETGVWMGMEGDTNNLRKVLHIGDVTQVGVLEEHHVFLVLAGENLFDLVCFAPSKTKMQKGKH